jgi:hypothetical protein
MNFALIAFVRGLDRWVGGTLLGICTACFALIQTLLALLWHTLELHLVPTLLLLGTQRWNTSLKLALNDYRRRQDAGEASWKPSWVSETWWNSTFYELVFAACCGQVMYA